MIEGKLVNLRAMEIGDAERAHRWMNDREVTEHLNMRYPLSMAAEQAYVAGNASSPIGFDAPAFAIETKDGIHIGGLNFHRTAPEDRKALLGISIGDKAYWSRGYGTDAIVTLLRFAFDEMNLHRVELTVRAPNERARACYRKCGFVDEVLMRQAVYAHGAYIDEYVMAVLRDEFYALHGAP